MPSTYDRERSLPLRVEPELRARLDALVKRLPAALRLPRNTVAVAALARGLEQLAAELARDPMAVHRALAGEALDPTRAREALASTPSRESTSTTPTAPRVRPGGARGTRGPSTEHTPTVEGRDAAPPPDSGALLKRWKRSGLQLAPFCRTHHITRSAMQAWLAGRPAKPATLASISVGLDAEGK